MLFGFFFSEGKSVDELFPYFFAFAKKIYPQFEFQKDLQLISDLTQPANWWEYINPVPIFCLPQHATFPKANHLTIWFYFGRLHDWTQDLDFMHLCGTCCKKAWKWRFNIRIFLSTTCKTPLWILHMHLLKK